MTAPVPTRVSGPAQYSQRTDNGQPIRSLPDAKYGENRDFVAQQQAAPLAKGPDRPNAPSPSEIGAMMTGIPQTAPSEPMAQMGPSPEITPLSSPTAYPDQPVTQGMQMGMGAPRPQEPQFKPGQLSEALRPYAAADDSGILADLIWQLTDQGL